MEKLIVDNFRCFEGENSFALKPLNLLVGENSSGKTSFLAAVRLASRLFSLRMPESVNFNDPPYNLGGFSELVHSGTPQAEKKFRLGAVDQVRSAGRRHDKTCLTAAYAEADGLPKLDVLKIESETSRWSFEARRLDAKKLETERFQGRLGRPGKPDLVKEFDLPADSFAYHSQFNIALSSLFRQMGPTVTQDADSQFVAAFLYSPERLTKRVIAPSPIRAEPKRVYESLDIAPTPQGDHIPMYLARIFEGTDWDNLAGPLRDFAKASGLFNDITVKRFARLKTNPFQIRVKLGKSFRPIVDVGYGVSQILPLLVDLLQNKGPGIYLLQQPEVHLHPRAQAELGTLFSSLVLDPEEGRQLFIETHSDYIVDRVRIEIRKNPKLAERAQILYFERKNGKVQVGTIGFDEQGNLLNTPPSYREFFLREESRFLGFE